MWECGREVVLIDQLGVGERRLVIVVYRRFMRRFKCI